MGGSDGLHEVSEVIGPAANRASETRAWRFVARCAAVPLKTDPAMVQFCPRVSVVQGDVIDIGEPDRPLTAGDRASRLRE